MRIKQSDELYRENAPYLFEEEEDGHAIHVAAPDSEGDLRLSVDYARYVPAAIRTQRANNSWYPNPDRAYEWSGIGVHLTRKQALRLAAKLIKQASKEKAGDNA